jgi:hypothetical protein
MDILCAAVPTTSRRSAPDSTPLGSASYSAARVPPLDACRTPAMHSTPCLAPQLAPCTHSSSAAHTSVPERRWLRPGSLRRAAQKAVLRSSLHSLLRARVASLRSQLPLVCGKEARSGWGRERVRGASGLVRFQGIWIRSELINI